MLSVNKVILMGNVGKDPEVKYVEKDLPVATFSLATSTRYIPKGSSQAIEHTEWHRIVVWRHLAKIAEQYVRKGMALYIEGKLQTRSWTDQQGNQHFATEIVANELQMITRKNTEQDSSATTPQNVAAEAEPEYKKEEAPVEDNLPF